MWRDHKLEMSSLRLTTEAVAIGFAMEWLSTGFVRAGLPAWGWLVQALACLVFSLQFLAVAVTIRSMRRQPMVAASAATAVVAVVGELLEAWCGVSWSVSNFSLTVGNTPLAQWSRWITPFGVAGLLYLVNFLLIPNPCADRKRRWIGPVIGAGVLGVAWCGGGLIAAHTSVAPLSFSVMLVQPPLVFHDLRGNQHGIAVSVCYESFLPWLPQYRRSANEDAIIHLVYDGKTAEYPGMIQRHIRMCQFRAIETRKWNLVCSTWAGTSIIDPTGRIIRQLPPVAGVLRTDAL